MCCLVSCSNLFFCHIPSSHKHIWCFRNIVFNSGKRTLGPRITNEKWKHWGLMLISYGCKSEGFQQSLWNHPTEILVSNSGSKPYRPVIFTGLKFFHSTGKFCCKLSSKELLTNITNAEEVTKYSRKASVALVSAPSNVKYSLNQTKYKYLISNLQDKKKWILTTHKYIFCT